MRRLAGVFLAAGLAVPVPGGLATAGERVFADAGCDLTFGETGIVEAVLDGTTLQLGDGLVVRLAAVDVPVMAEGEARRIVSDLTLGQPVRLGYGAIRRDRYGRATAQLYLGSPDDQTWVQAALVDAGAARVMGFADDRTCLGTLLGHERAARSAGEGLWATTGPLAATSPSLRRAEGLYELVEARLESVGRTERTVYLNFGGDWSTDFTVTLTAADARAAEREGGPLEALVGRRIRVRGWLVQRDGPNIRVDHPEQIEILDD